MRFVNESKKTFAFIELRKLSVNARDPSADKEIPTVNHRDSKDRVIIFDKRKRELRCRKVKC